MKIHTVKFLLLAADWIVILIVFASNTSSSSNWEIKTQIVEPSQNVVRQQAPVDENVKTFKDYGGIVPLSYDVTIKAPLTGNIVFSQTFNGSVVITFVCKRPTKYLYFQIKELLPNTSDVRLVELNDSKNVVPINKVYTFLDLEKLALDLNVTLRSTVLYSLTIGKFTGPIKSGNSEGFFASDPFMGADVVEKRRSYVYATQFQLTNARTVFPCVDRPEFKSNLTLKLVHPGDYTSLSNDRITLTTNNDGAEDLFFTYFETTPRLPTYTMAFVLLPKFIYENITKINVKVSEEYQKINFTVYYNRYQITANQASLLLKYAEYAYCYLDRQWRVTLPLKKLDLVIIPQFIVYGMENWGLITLSEEFILKSSDDTQFSLIAHEIAHQWLSNLVTIQSWTYLCFQEGLTEHYARRIVRDFYLSQSHNNFTWFLHLISRYLPAIKEETDDDSLTPLIQSNFMSVTQVARWCFNKAPFVISSLEFLAGTKTFDSKVSEFLRRYQYGNFVFDDFARYFDAVIVNNRRVSQYLRFSYEHGGYPTLFVDRFYDGTKKISLIRRQITVRKNWTYESTNVDWMTPLTCVHSKGFSATNYCNLKIMDADNLTLDVGELDDTDWIVFNDEFKFFYRVNYDLENWRMLSFELASPNCRLDLLTQVQLVNDFCFFKKLTLIQSNDLTYENFKNVYYQLQNKTGIHFEFYTAECV